MSTGLRILLVDDDVMVRDVVALLLEDLGHAVTAADSASAALTALESGAPVHLVLTDYRMRYMDGTALAGEIRRRRPDLRIGLLTGTLTVAEEATPLFDFVLTKPVTPAQLRAAIGEARS